MHRIILIETLLLRPFKPRQCTVNGQQACAAFIENQAICQGHFRAHRIIAEDHPWIEKGELA
jgi:hypothetical protein